MRPYRIFACCVIYSLIGSIPALSAEKCTLTLLASLNAALSEDHRFHVPVHIEGKLFYMTVDTGGLVSTLHESAARELGISISSRNAFKNRTQLRDGGGAALNYGMAKAAVSIGALQDEKTEFLVIPDPDGAKPPSTSQTRLAGSLGQNFLSLYDVEFDPHHKKLRLFSQDRCRGRAVYWAKTYFEIPFRKKFSTPISKRRLPSFMTRDMPILERDEAAPAFGRVRLDGYTLYASIDTGSSQSILDIDRARRRFDIDPKEDKLAQGEDVQFIRTQDVKTYVHQFGRLDIGGVSFVNPVIKLAHLDKTRDMPRLIIGMDRLKHMRFYMAYREGVLYGTPADATLENSASGPAPMPVSSSP